MCPYAWGTTHLRIVYNILHMCEIYVICVRIVYNILHMCEIYVICVRIAYNILHMCEIYVICVRDAYFWGTALPIHGVRYAYSWYTKYLDMVHEMHMYGVRDNCTWCTRRVFMVYEILVNVVYEMPKHNVRNGYT